MRGFRTLTAALIVAALFAIALFWIERSRSQPAVGSPVASPAAVPEAPASPAPAPAPEPPPPPSSSSDKSAG